MLAVLANRGLSREDIDILNVRGLVRYQKHIRTCSPNKRLFWATGKGGGLPGMWLGGAFY